MRKRLYLFFCLMLLCGFAFSQSDAVAETIGENQLNGQQIVDAINDIQRNIQTVDGNLGSLKSEIASLSDKIKNLQGTTQKTSPLLLPAALILMFLCLLILGAVAANFVLQKKKIDEMLENIAALKKMSSSPAARTASPLSMRSSAAAPARSFSERMGSSERSFDTAESRAPVPLTPVDPPPVRSVQPVAAPISELYNSVTKREARRNGNADDKWMIVNKDVYQRILQGEHIAVCFNEGASYFGAEYVLVNGKYLYPNYHKFNETQPIRETEVLGLVYDISGGPNGFIKRCEPAVMTPSGGSFTLAKKGRIELEK
jgi:hypothetical protein